jgi:non-canonical (house-cleaning) NTP pyrophosphatase
MIIAVGSGTGLKPKCVAEVFYEHKVIAIPISSGVSEQPIGKKETKQGAMNRAIRSLEEEKDADIAFGIENGLIKDNDNNWIDIACIICIDRNNKIIEKWSDALDIPKSWGELAESDKSISYVKALKQKYEEYKLMDSHDPHNYLTNGKKPRAIYLKETLEIIKKEI